MIRFLTCLRRSHRSLDTDQSQQPGKIMVIVMIETRIHHYWHKGGGDWYRTRPNNGYRQRLNTEIICLLLSENDLKLQLLIIGTDGTGNDVSPENAISNEMKNVRNDAPTIFFSQSTVICVFDKCRSHDSDHNMKSIIEFLSCSWCWILCFSQCIRWWWPRWLSRWWWCSPVSPDFLNLNSTVSLSLCLSVSLFLCLWL